MPIIYLQLGSLNLLARLRYYSILNISLLGEEYEAHINAMENVTFRYQNLKFTKFSCLSKSIMHENKNYIHIIYIYIYIICKESSDNFKDAKFF